MANETATQNTPTGAQTNQVSTLDPLSQLILNSVARQGSPLDGLNSRLPASNNPAPMPVLQGSTQDLEQRAAAAPRTAPAAPAPPSDDPDITRARAGITDTQNALQSRMKTYEGTQAKIAALPPVNPADHKPSWTDRLMGAGEGFLLGYGKGNEARGAEAGANLTHRGLEKAEAARNAQLKPLLEQLNAEREEIPLLNSSNETAWRGFEAVKDSKDLDRKQELADTKQEFDEKLNELRQKAEADKNQHWIDTLNELSERNKNQNQNAQDKLDMQAKLLDLREEMLRDKEAKSGKGTPVQFSNAEAKKAQGLQKAQADYNRATKGLNPNNPEDLKTIHDAHDAFDAAQQEVENAYEAEVNSLGGSASHQDVVKDWRGSNQPAASPAAPATPARPSAQPPAAPALAKGDLTPTASQWKDPSKGLRVKQPSGAVQLWKLDNGKPVLVSTDTGKK